MSKIQFLHAHQDNNFRAVGLIGHSVALALGAVSAGCPELAFNVTDEPAGSDLFESGSDLGYLDLAELTFTHSGVHVLTATTGNGEVVHVTVLVWPAEVLEVDEIKYLDRPIRVNGPTLRPGQPGDLTNSPRERNLQDKLSVLRSLARHCNLDAAAAALESSPGAPYYGCLPVENLGYAQGNLAAFGAAYA